MGEVPAVMRRPIGTKREKMKVKGKRRRAEFLTGVSERGGKGRRPCEWFVRRMKELAKAA